ncbi:acetyltransferase [Sabulicella glaciei]|uniref:Acetyltransferase n=1 Tax=Sabulicella glaciei TaxID=2984948 RepID=A0ABT3NZB3_9PROT|nr:acetyltransferase [Roseococcus sp. MDT2-1-1]MCW8087499.1 acetyltransferase [Roseococcus sp. MDT2-1-1]
MPEKSKDLVLIGDSAFAEVAHEYFEAYTDYRVVAFTVEQAYMTREVFRGLPVVPLEALHETHPPATHHVHVAVVYTQLNRLRARLVETARARGYPLASFISPQAFIAPSANIGEHCFIFESNVVQSFVSVGRNVVLWSGNHIGHHSHIADNVFVSSHVVISGLCRVGANSFLGVNSALADRTVLAEDCWVGPAVTLSGSTNAGQMFRGPETMASRVDARRFFRIRAEASDRL